MEQRRERRNHFTEIVFESASGQREARLSEVSLGGCFIDTIVDTPVGEQVSFQVIGHDPPVRFSGEVIYTFPGIGFGLKFADLSPSGEEYLKSIMGDANA